ncbi:diaminopimelate epimerase [bacterium]|nr:diaminopimelate epimerase [bacterium]
MKLNFSKYHGAGNDFVMVDNRTDDRRLWDALSPEVIAHLCHRHFGIGADGLIMAIKSGGDTPYTMGYFNADGSRAEMCGNGLRCLVRFLDDLGEPVRDMEEIRIMTGAGPIASRFNPTDDNLIQVAMPIPRFEPERAKISVDAEHAIDHQVFIPGVEEPVIGTAVGVGNPHFVLFRPDMWDGSEVHDIGYRLGIHEELFPEGVNVGFARKEGQNHMALVVHERGVGPTLACGSGAVAAVGAGIATERFELEQRVQVRMPGGVLFVTIGSQWSWALLEGEAVHVFSGEIDV